MGPLRLNFRPLAGPELQSRRGSDRLNVDHQGPCVGRRLERSPVARFHSEGRAGSLAF
jgi:hypothetical protein